MAKRPDISVIFLFNQGVIRTDFTKTFEAPVFKIQESIDVESSILDSVRQVVHNHPAPGVRTVVVSPGVWSQIVALPYLSVKDIEPDELEVALKFETETLSGIEINEIALAYSCLGQQDEFEQYWVSAISRSDLEGINQYLASVGCREIAITHPAGLSGDPAQRPGPRRIEIWDDLAYFLTHRSTHLERIKQASTTSISESGAETVLLGTGTRTRAVTSEITRLDIDDSIEVLDLDEDLPFNQWAGRVAANYLKHSDSLQAPLIRRIKRSRVTPVRHFASALIAAAVLCFCVWHWRFIDQHNAMISRQIIEIQEPGFEKIEHDSLLITILEERVEIESEDSSLGDDLKRIRFFLDHQNNRFSRLLNLLVELRTPDLMMNEISGTEDGLSISGISLNGESAQALAKRLREYALPLGWIVNPARLQGQEKLTTGGPWLYEILLTDTGPFEFALQPRKKTAPLLAPKP